MACLVFATGSASAALTPQQIVSNINTLTFKSQQLQAPAQSINIINGPLIAVGLGPFPPIIRGFADIVATATTALSAMQGTPNLSSSDCKLVADAFREFVRVHQILLNILIGKAGLFSAVPLIGAPVSQALRAIEGIVDSLAFSLIDIAQDAACKTTIQNDSGALKGTITTAITRYDGLFSLNSENIGN
jgi:hypothetical protein